MKTTGYFKVWRGIWDEFNKPFLPEVAWLWMISEAEYESGPLYGCVVASLNILKEEWGWDTRRQVQWQLEKWKKDERIEFITIQNHVQKACSSTCSSGTLKRAAKRAVMRAIKLINYDTYQSGTIKSRAVQRAIERAVSVQDNVQKACSNNPQTLLNSGEQSPLINNKEERNNIREEYRGTIKYATKKLSTDLSTGTASEPLYEKHPDVLKAEIEKLITHFKKDIDSLYEDEEPTVIDVESATSELKQLFEAGYDYNEIKRCIDRFVRDSLEWMETPTRTVEAFVVNLSRYLDPQPIDQPQHEDQLLDSQINQLPEDERHELYQIAEDQALQTPMRRFKDNPQAWQGAIQAQARIIYQERQES